MFHYNTGPVKKIKPCSFLFNLILLSSPPKLHVVTFVQVLDFNDHRGILTIIDMYFKISPESDPHPS